MENISILLNGSDDDMNCARQVENGVEVRRLEKLKQRQNINHIIDSMFFNDDYMFLDFTS